MVCYSPVTGKQGLKSCPIKLWPKHFEVFALHWALAILTTWSSWDKCSGLTQNPMWQVWEMSSGRSKTSLKAIYDARWAPTVFWSPRNVILTLPYLSSGALVAPFHSQHSSLANAPFVTILSILALRSLKNFCLAFSRLSMLFLPSCMQERKKERKKKRKKISSNTIHRCPCTKHLAGCVSSWIPQSSWVFGLD